MAKQAAALAALQRTETDVPMWFWLNIPAMVLVFSAVVGIATWLVLKWSHEQRHDSRPAPAREFQPSTPSPRPRREVQLTR